MKNLRHSVAFWASIVFATAGLLASFATPESRDAGNPIRPISLSASSFLLTFSVALKVIHRRRHAGVIPCQPSPANVAATSS
jgi:hypothetical protein